MEEVLDDDLNRVARWQCESSRGALGGQGPGGGAGLGGGRGAGSDSAFRGRGGGDTVGPVAGSPRAAKSC
jgi:hypothetical protein